MQAKTGDILSMPSEKAGQPERRGEIVEVLGDSVPSETIVAPRSDARIESSTDH